MGNSTTTTVKTDAGPVVVRKLALGEYAELFKKINTLPAEAGKALEQTPDAQLRNNETLFPLIIQVAIKSISEFYEVLAAGTDKDPEFFEKKVDLEAAVEIFLTIVEVNGYWRISDTVKKAMARHRPSPTPDKAAKPVKK